MRLAEFGALYGLVGMGCAVVVAIRPSSLATRMIDALLMAAFWPMYAPFLLAGGRQDEGKSREVAFLAALRRAGGTPLAALLPDEKTARALARRLRVAGAKVEEIDTLLRRPEFDEVGAMQRIGDLQQRGGSECAASTAAIRVQNIRRLRSLRNRFARELDEVGELLQQLTTQAEVVRLAGTPDSEARDVLQEILSRVEGLDRMLDDDPYAVLEEPKASPFSA